MKNNITQRTSHAFSLFGGSVVAIALIASVLYAQNAHAMITSSLDLGSNGAQVTELQTYYATNASIYPSGLVTGYFGSLTQTATQKFQTAQGIVTSGTPSTTGYGRVGPQTIVKLNALMGGGYTTQPTSWDAVPVINPPTIQVTNSTATFVWTTNEVTQGQVFFDTTPLRTDESTGPLQQAYISGTFVADANGSQSVHTVTIPNLQSNTTYHFLVRAIDSGGNVSITWPSTFRTNQ